MSKIDLKTIKIRKIKSDDLEWMKKLFIKRWCGDFVVTRGKIHRPENQDGFIAEVNGKNLA